MTNFEKILIDNKTQTKLKKDDKIPDKLKKAEFTEISFAAKIEKNKIKALKGEESLIFTYLPTKVTDFNFPFLVNGNFLTNASREAIHEDRFWNQWLFKIIGIKLFDWLELLTYSNYKFQILHLLPNRFRNHQNKLKISFDKAFKKTVKFKKFILNRNNKLKKASDILIDKTGISGEEFISIDVLIEYINKVNNKSFKANAFIHPKIELEYKLNDIGVTTFDLENLEDFFTDESFMSSHKPIDNFQLIEYFFYKSNKSGSKEFREKLKSIPFIYTEDKKLKSPQTVCFPSIDYRTEFGEGVSVIHKKVYPKIETDPRIKDWLESLGVQDPSDLAYIENEIIGNIEGAINELNYLHITRFLFNQHKKGILEEWHYAELQNLKIYTTKKEFKPAIQCYLSRAYEPTLELDKIIQTGNYVSEKYILSGDLSSEWKTFFIKIGVIDDLTPEKYTIKYDREKKWKERFDKDFLEQIWKISQRYSWISYKGWTTEEDIGYQFFPSGVELFGLPILEFSKEYSFFKLLFQRFFTLFDPFELFNDKSIQVKGATGFISRIISREMLEDQSCPTNYMQWILSNTEIFPTTLKECKKPSEIFLNTGNIKEIASKYLPVLNCDVTPDEDWLKYIPFKQKLEIDDYLTILEKIAKETGKDKGLKNANKRRIGLIYTSLVKQLENLSSRKKAQISKWAAENKLLSSTEKFENANELKWVKISKFSNTSDQLKTIFIPDNCDMDSERFEELLVLFGVQVIDSFIPEIKGAELNLTLKTQLQLILPYLVALIEKKQYADFSDEYKRISEIVDSTEFYNTSEINLSLKNHEELISGPSPNAYLENNRLYFKGKWTSPLTLYALAPELIKLFGITGLTEELKLLLLLDKNEIEGWFSEQGFDLSELQGKPEYLESLETVKSSTSEEDIEQSDDLVDNSDARSRISISQNAKEIIFKNLRLKGFDVPDTLDIDYTIVRGIKNPKGVAVKIVVKSGKAGKTYFTPNEWLALTEADTQLFIVTRGDIVRNVTLNDLEKYNETFHMRLNTQSFAVATNLKAFANFFRYLSDTHFIFDTPESTTDYLQEFGLNQRNPSADTLTSDDKNLLY